MKNDVNIEGITPRIAELILDNGVYPIADVLILRLGWCSTASLLALCLDGSDPDDSESWHEYVSAVAIAAGVS